MLTCPYVHSTRAVCFMALWFSRPRSPMARRAMSSLVAAEWGGHRLVDIGIGGLATFGVKLAYDHFVDLKGDIKDVNGKIFLLADIKPRLESLEKHSQETRSDLNEMRKCLSEVMLSLQQVKDKLFKER